MKAFEYVAPGNTADALQALAGHDRATALAGGTDLINRMKEDLAAPGRVVYLKKIAELGGIKNAENGGITLGAGTRLVEILESAPIKNHYQAIRQATTEIATPQIRNMATLGGNLLQRPRCWYYRNGFGLMGGRTEGESLVQELEAYAPRNYSAPNEGRHVVRSGDNRYGAIFMTDGDALFVAPSSLAPALIALGAKATLQGPEGERTVAVEDLYQVPTADVGKELTLRPGELLTKVSVPPARGKNATYEVRWKQSHDWPLVLASVSLELDGDKVTKARVVLGSVAPVPYRSEEAEAAITGKAVNRETARAAGEAAAGPAKPLSMNAYKVELTKVAVQRALLAAVGDRYWEEA